MIFSENRFPLFGIMRWPPQPSVNGRCDRTLALGIPRGRGVQRKVFRIEQMFAGGRAAAAAPAVPAEQRHLVDKLKALRALAERRDESGAEAVDLLKRELALVRDTIARNRRDLAALIGDGKQRGIARAADELGTAVDGMEKATQKILLSAEVVDESAKALTATLRGDYKRGLAQDIQDHVVQIYEACNFQDLAGQRIGNAVATLAMLEARVSAMLDRCEAGSGKDNSAVPAKAAAGPDLLNGPRLDGDAGHASQRDIDEIFG
jgi:chemotaxis protein CheZ